MSDDARQLERARTEVLRKYAGRSSSEAVATTFDQVVAEFADARVRAFVPVLVERRVRERLLQSA